MKIRQLHIEGDTMPAAAGRLPVRIILHRVPGVYPIVTHAQVQHPDGEWHTSSGIYFDDLGEALANFHDRCRQLERLS